MLKYFFLVLMRAENEAGLPQMDHILTKGGIDKIYKLGCLIIHFPTDLSAVAEWEEFLAHGVSLPFLII